MLISILIDVQYLENAFFSVEKGLIGQNLSSSDSHHLVKNYLQQNFQFPLKFKIPPTP